MVSILIVDDDKPIHRVFEKILEIRGHQVVGHAYDGDEAVEAYLHSQPYPDLVLMDHRMPGKDGLTATAEILSAHPEANIIFVSADETVIDEALKIGATHFLVKPIRGLKLAEVLNLFVSKESSQVANEVLDV